MLRKAGIGCVVGDIGNDGGCGENVHDDYEALKCLECTEKCLMDDECSRLVSSEVASREVDNFRLVTSAINL